MEFHMEKDTPEPTHPLFKVLIDGRACHGGDLQWSLPVQSPGDEGWQPGEWHAVEPPIQVCERGLHLTSDPLAWLRTGAMVYRAEGAGATSEDGSDKTAFERARLLAPAPEMIPYYWDSWLPFVRDVIPATPFFKPDGNPDPTWRLFTAPTWDAARAAATDAAWAARWGAAWDAARDAATDAAWDAATDAAWGAARDAATDAARAAAWDAAWDAATDAARATAWGAARAAARDAELFAVSEFVCADLALDSTHREHVRARWNVWQKGYALLRDVDGVLYVYGVQP
jgi:hypothetical protein